MNGTFAGSRIGKSHLTGRPSGAQNPITKVAPFLLVRMAMLRDENWFPYRLALPRLEDRGLRRPCASGRQVSAQQTGSAGWLQRSLGEYEFQFTEPRLLNLKRKKVDGRLTAARVERRIVNFPVQLGAQTCTRLLPLREFGSIYRVVNVNLIDLQQVGPKICEKGRQSR